MNTTPLVVVIDDDESVRKSLSRLLKTANLDVATYANAQALLQAEFSDRPTCILMDLRMPQMNGLELQEALARGGWVAPIVFLSGHGDVASVTRAMKAGAVDFLQKPVEEDRLLQAVNQALERARLAQTENHRRREIETKMALLTPREREVFQYVVSGWLNKQVALELGVTEKTIKVHRARVMAKMDVGSLAELVRLANSAGIEVVKQSDQHVER